MSKFSILVAVAQNRVIGKDNELLWHISEDLKRFKRITLEHTVIMGHKTYLSLPVKPFPKRRNVVITRNTELVLDGCQMAYSLEEALQLASEGENFIIGGGTIYEQWMPYCQKMYVTELLHDFEGDVFFPPIDPKQWRREEESEVFCDPTSGLSYRYITYVKK